jgi:hypothetical protein
MSLKDSAGWGSVEPPAVVDSGALALDKFGSNEFGSELGLDIREVSALRRNPD